MMYRVQVGTGRRVQCRAQYDCIQKGIVGLRSIVESDQVFWVVLLEQVSR